MANSTSGQTDEHQNGDGDGEAAGAGPAAAPSGRERGYHLEIFLIAFASLLLEISYTRIVSFKLFYYYTYLVIGLALLGIGCGSVVTSISGRVKRASTDSILILCSLVGAVSIAVGYLVVSRIPVASLALWDYGSRDSVWNFVKLVVVCLALFASFVWIGVMISTLFSRKTEGINKLYFADLVGAGLACAVVVFLISAIGPPRIVALSATIVAAVGLMVAVRVRSRAIPVGAVLVAVLAICVVASSLLPDVRPDDDKAEVAGATHSEWSPIFRVDAIDLGDSLLLNHDGLLGSVIKKWDGDVASLGGENYKFDSDPRSFPFDLLGQPPENVMIIGAAGGHEILASLYYEAENIDAIELNPLTYDLVTDRFADYGGHVADQPGVNYVNGDGRSYLARSDDEYELIWYPAPDSYSATNAASAGAFVLSESYLYTTETVEESLEHLTDDGIVATQFGEINFEAKPNRTTRYVATVREALERFGVEDPTQHVLVATTPGGGSTSVLSTVLVKRTPFTGEEIASFVGQDAAIEGNQVQYAPGAARIDNSVTNVLTLPAAEQEAYLDDYPYEVDAITDDGPFFWHFSGFGTVLNNFGDSIDRFDPEDSIGERVIVLLLALATILAAVFLLLPFVTMRKVWRELPRKANSAVFFGALGLGFMFFEITLIQRLILFLGYPTYSLTVTLASLLIFTGLGALASARFKGRIDQATKVLAPVVVVLGLAYLFLLPMLTDALLTTPLGLRIVVAFVVLAPLGAMLGMFMPLGLGVVSGLTRHGEEYVAWSWAVNGFASVIGSVLTTIIAMIVGFNVVLALSMVVYLVAVAALRRLARPLEATSPAAESEAASESGESGEAEPVVATAT
jgi:hypothetical protein